MPFCLCNYLNWMNFYYLLLPLDLEVLILEIHKIFHRASNWQYCQPCFFFNILKSLEKVLSNPLAISEDISSPNASACISCNKLHCRNVLLEVFVIELYFFELALPIFVPLAWIYIFLFVFLLILSFFAFHFLPNILSILFPLYLIF